MARILCRLLAAQAAIDQKFGRKRVCPRIRRSGSNSFSNHRRFFVAAISGRRKFSSVISDRQRGADIHRTLSSIYLFRRFRLLEEVYGGLVSVIGDEIRRFFETETTQRAAGIHIPLPRGVLGLFAQFVCHSL